MVTEAGVVGMTDVAVAVAADAAAIAIVTGAIRPLLLSSDNRGHKYRLGKR